MKRKETIGKLKNFFGEKSTTEDIKYIPENEQKGYMDDFNIFMIIPKTNVAEEILLSNFELGEPHKVPEIDYNQDKGIPSSKYSIEYIVRIFELIKCFAQDESSIRLTLNTDYPLMIDTEHFKIILAPIFDND